MKRENSSDSLIKKSTEGTLQDWVPINGKSTGLMKVMMFEENNGVNAEVVFGEEKSRSQDLNTALVVKQQHPGRKVILITKDINLRLKAKALGLVSEDYKNDKIVDVKFLRDNVETIEGINSGTIDKIYAEGHIGFKQILKEEPFANQCFVLKNGSSSVLASYNKDEQIFERVNKSSAYGIKPRNAEQVFALNAILNPNIKLVALQGISEAEKPCWLWQVLWNKDAITARYSWLVPSCRWPIRTSVTCRAISSRN